MRTMSDIIGAIMDYMSLIWPVSINSRTNQQQVFSLAFNSCGLVDSNHGQRTQVHIVWTKSVKKGINCRLKLKKGIGVSSVHQ